MNCIYDIRLEQFLQLKNKIRGPERHLIFGINAAEDKYSAFLVQRGPRLWLQSWSLTTRLKAFRSCSLTSSESKFNTA